jgi:hypothetical protein
VRKIGTAQRRARLAVRHLLLEPTRTDDLPAIADSVVALHSSDPVTVFLSAMVRMRHPSVAAVEAALYDDRALVRHHAMRRTLWVATPPVVRTMHAAATTALVGPEERRSAQLLAASGIDEPVRWLADAREQVDAALREHGALTARELGQKVPALTHKIVMAPGKKYSANVSAHTRVLLQLGFEGKVVRGRPTGTWVNGAYRYAAMDDWLDGGVGALDRREAARELVDRYLRRFGPVTTKDVQWWAGWTLATTKAALRDCEAEPVSLEEGDGWVAAGDRELFDEQAWVGVLPSLDPTTMGWKEREWYLPAEAEDTFDRYGNAGPTLWVDGEVVGAWAQAPDGELRSTYLVPVSARRRRQVAARLDDVAAMIGDTKFTVRFPGRVNAKLLAD